MVEEKEPLGIEESFFYSSSLDDMEVLFGFCGFWVWSLTPSGMSRKGSLLGNLLDKSIFAQLSFVLAVQKKSVWVSWSPARWCCALGRWRCYKSGQLENLPGNYWASHEIKVSAYFNSQQTSLPSCRTTLYASNQPCIIKSHALSLWSLKSNLFRVL